MGRAPSTEATVELTSDQIVHFRAEGDLRAPSITTAATVLGNRSDHQRAARQIAIGSVVRQRSTER